MDSGRLDRRTVLYFVDIASFEINAARNIKQRAMATLTNFPLDNMAVILAEDVFKCNFLNENYRVQFSLKFVSWSPIDNTPALVQTMA